MKNLDSQQRQANAKKVLDLLYTHGGPLLLSDIVKSVSMDEGDVLGALTFLRCADTWPLVFARDDLPGFFQITSAGARFIKHSHNVSSSKPTVSEEALAVLAEAAAKAAEAAAKAAEVKKLEQEIARARKQELLSLASDDDEEDDLVVVA